MENPYPETVVYSHEQNSALENEPERPLVATKEKPILLRVFYKVFLGFFVEIGSGIFNFFKRYILLIWSCLKFLWKPNADEHTKANKKTLENAKETFELILIITAIALFLIKQNVIESTDNLKELYGNDIGQYTIEFILFLVYSLIFFAVLIILVLVGRLLRVMFKSIETRDVTDKVFINLNNIFFLLTMIFAFVKKCGPGSRSEILGETDNTEYVIEYLTYYCIPLACIVFLFFIRLVTINKVTIGRIFTYCIIAPAFITIILAFCGLVITALFAGI